MRLKDKVVLITGAGRGLGAAMAVACAREGAKVVCTDLGGESGLGAVVSGIRASGGTAHAVTCDVSSRVDLERMVGEAVAVYGGIHGLINNAGLNYVKPFLDVTEQEWDRIMNVDLKGAFFLTQLCARQMLRQEPRGGSIVQIGSVHTLASLAGAAPYDAAKHGVVGFSKAAAVELAREGVRVNVLSPGLCHTAIWKDIVEAAPSEKECVDYWNANIPGGRLIEPDEVAKICVFLLSDDSSSMTGANVVADLGMTSLLVSREPYASGNILEK